MTVSTTTASKQYPGTGSTTNFPTTFRFLENSHIKVVLTDAAGTDTEWTLGTQYTLSGAGDANGGTLTVITTPTDYTPASGETLTLLRVAPMTQETALPLGGPLPSTSVERMVDQAVMNVQQLSQSLGGKVGFPSTDSVTLSAELPSAGDRASKFMAFDASGNVIASAGPTGASAIPVSSYIETLLDDTDAATARSTLGLEIPSQVEAEAGTATTARAWTAERVAQAIAALAVSGPASVQVFTASDTWTRPSGITRVVVKVIGAGGGGGGADNTAGGQGAVGGGGGGGGYGEKLIDVTNIASSTITIGTGGAGGAAGGVNDGSSGGDSSWADGTNTVTGGGGSGGFAGNAAVNSVGRGGAGGTATGGDVNASGHVGGFAFGVAGSNGGGGHGGGSFIGGGGIGAAPGNDGVDAVTPGSGGGGAAEGVSSAGQAGGDGADGTVIVWEYK